MVVNDDQNTFTCAYCGGSTSLDESEDLGWRKYKTECMEETKYPDPLKPFYDEKLPIGRMISMSKSAYSEKYPDHCVLYNANIITAEDKKIWFGDLDLNVDSDKLKRIAYTMNKDLYILSERDCRFENENDSISKLLSKARFRFYKEGLIKNFLN
jgi:hypothetical protein